MNPREIKRLSLAALVPDPAQPRRHMPQESLKALAQSLLTEGQIHPGLVGPVLPDGKHPLLDGNRRYYAAEMAGLTELDVIEVDVGDKKGGILELQLVTTIQREDLNPIDKARGMQRLIDEAGYTRSQLAAALALSAATVSRLLVLLDLPKEVQDKIAEGAIPASTAYELARIDDREQQAQLAAEVASGGLTRDKVTRRLKAPAKRSDKPAPKGRITAQLGGRRSVVLAGPGLESVEHLIEWLEELLGRARKVRQRMTLPTFIASLRDEARTGAEAETGEAA